MEKQQGHAAGIGFSSVVQQKEEKARIRARFSSRSCALIFASRSRARKHEIKARAPTYSIYSLYCTDVLSFLPSPPLPCPLWCCPVPMCPGSGKLLSSSYILKIRERESLGSCPWTCGLFSPHFSFPSSISIVRLPSSLLYVLVRSSWSYILSLSSSLPLYHLFFSYSFLSSAYVKGTVAWDFLSKVISTLTPDSWSKAV
jgi:hypothetical protein